MTGEENSTSTKVIEEGFPTCMQYCELTHRPHCYMRLPRNEGPQKTYQLRHTARNEICDHYANLGGGAGQVAFNDELTA